MSAAEVIELIKKLPPDEKAEVVAFVTSGTAAVMEDAQVKYLSQAEAERRAAEIFKKNDELFRRLAQ